MSDSPWQYFPISDLVCRCGCGRWEMDHDFMPKIVGLRRTLGFPFIVSSAYRCPEYNARVSHSGMDGPHTTGRAMDIKLHGDRVHALLRLAGDMGMTGIGLSQKGDWAARFVHLDDLSYDVGRPRPWVWTY